MEPLKGKMKLFGILDFEDIMGICHSNQLVDARYLDHPCPICTELINLDYHDRHMFRNLTTPCCKQSMHQTCWEKSINRYGRCPLCNVNHVPEEFMKSIQFCVAYEMQHGANLHDALTQTFCFAKCSERDQQITNPCFLGDTICFTDDLYWNHTSQNIT